MDCSKLFTIIGLILNTLAALVLIIPSLSLTKNVEEDFILGMDKKGNFTQKKHLKERKINLLGLVLLCLGFALQLLGLVLF